MAKNVITIKSEEESGLRKELESRTDADSLRIKRYLDMPDLSRTKGSPIYEMVERIVALPDFKKFDINGWRGGIKTNAGGLNPRHF